MTRSLWLASLSETSLGLLECIGVARQLAVFHVVLGQSSTPHCPPSIEPSTIMWPLPKIMTNQGQSGSTALQVLTLDGLWFDPPESHIVPPN